MVLLQHLYGLRSLRQTAQEAQVNMAYRWFLGYDLYESTPHFSTLSYNFKHRFGSEVFEEIFNMELDDVFCYAEIVDDDCVEDNILYKEDIDLLRRELALMAKDYRDIIVSYYFDNKKIGTISKVTGLPEGTVKRKLYEARQNIKEGIRPSSNTFLHIQGVL